MKLSYEAQGVADADDDLLKRAIKYGKVPASCLMGGSIIQLVLERGGDPCEVCGISRTKCQGRPIKDPKNVFRLRRATESEAFFVDRLRAIANLEAVLGNSNSPNKELDGPKTLP